MLMSVRQYIYVKSKQIVMSHFNSDNNSEIDAFH